MHAGVQHRRALDVLASFLRLGCTSFGGPVAHIGYFRSEFVARREWLTEAEFADLLALCQFLPGPASSQLGMAIGWRHAGPLGALCAWLGFTLPSAVAMTAFGLGIGRGGDFGHAGWLRGLKLVAVAVVAQAVWGMARSLCPDRARSSLSVLAAMLVLSVPGSIGQLAAILLGAVAGVAVIARPPAEDRAAMAAVSAPGWAAAAALLMLAGLLLGLPLSADRGGFAGALFRTGSLVFGGGHVVLPLLQDAVVPPGWVGQGEFLAGYGAVQAMPGPLFTFAAFLGAVWGGVTGAWIATVAIFLPSFLLVAGALPFWSTLRNRPIVQGAVQGVNAAVVGVLLAALYTPVWTSAVAGPADFAMALAAFLLLTAWRTPPWLVVGLGAAAGALF